MAKQDFSIGNTVKVGFMTLVVKAKIPTPGDFLPDAYILANVAGTQLYKFVPHNGCEKISIDDARELLQAAERYAAREAAKAIAKAQAARKVDSLFA